MAAKIKVTKLAAVTGILLLNAPKTNHKNVPNVNNPYMESEMPDVSFVRMVLIACGKKESVVQNAATSPIIVIVFIFLFSLSTN